ncbi:MAG: hypothetical protein AAGH19_10950 [Pseudomonadota bacterium]
MGHSKKATKQAAPAEPRQDRQLAVLLEGVVDLELAAARHRLEKTNSPPRLVERALRLLRSSRMPDGFLDSPFEPDRHAALLDMPGARGRG